MFIVAMEKDMKKPKATKFGNWEGCYCLEGGEDLFYVSEMEKWNREVKQSLQIQKTALPMAMDEDLYKIPPELLHRIPKRRRMRRSIWSACLGLNCIA
ncbi:hypothetical protein AXF42_Ash006555 [Apostasia shenzhenica]|uniref:Uncharacterized protein n=1 Tax=Apostasia shenzhenica TaxID=1088818 RepID=A0A2I0AZE5_9ASPA|nr:hypothetical protein AXF42_Ash006555 [Apostasia shenzhenica]